MPRIVRSSIWMLFLLAAFPGRGLGQQPKAGIATIIEGDVTARRAAQREPVVLKFKDDVLLRDIIATAERSLARLLLGGKATVTVRERSQLTVTEIPGASLVQLGKGKIGLAVAPGRLRPGGMVQIRTPNTVVGVRGTVVVTDIEPTAALAAPAIRTHVYVLNGKVDVQELRGGVPVGPVFTVNSRQMITIPPPRAPQVTSFPESRVAAITAGLHPSKRSVGAGSAAKEAALRAAASNLSEGLAGGESRLPESDQSVRAPIVPVLPALPDSPAPTATAPPAQGPAPATPPVRLNPAPPATTLTPGKLR